MNQIFYRANESTNNNDFTCYFKSEALMLQNYSVFFWCLINLRKNSSTKETSFFFNGNLDLKGGGGILKLQ